MFLREIPIHQTPEAEYASPSAQSNLPFLLELQLHGWAEADDPPRGAK